MLILSIISLVFAVIFLLIGSGKSGVYNQMKKALIVDDYSSIINAGNEPFLLHGYVGISHKTVQKNMIASRTFNGEVVIDKNSPVITISLENGNIHLIDDYSIADYNINIQDGKYSIEGIKPGGEVTIYAANYKDDSFSGVKGYELYPGNPKQYISFLESPYNSYMLFVRLFIGLALLLFLISIVLNIKK